MINLGRLVDEGCIKLRLGWDDIELASNVGRLRAISAVQRQRQPGNGLFDNNMWTYHIEGACGECAFAKWCNVYWHAAIGRIDQPDVLKFQVKTNVSRTADNTILKPQDKKAADEIFIGVLSYLPDFYLCGWIRARDAMIDAYWRDGTPGRFAWFVPRQKLLPMSTLPKYGAPI